MKFQWEIGKNFNLKIIIDNNIILINYIDA